MTFSYFNPVKIDFCIDYLEAIKTIKDSKILLITSKSFSKKGISKAIENALNRDLVGIIDEIIPNPQIAFLTQLKNSLPDFDAIIAFGGGSVIDSAKFFSVNSMLQNGNLILHSKQMPRKNIYAIPTTSGTSSELTHWATIWDKSTMTKYSLNHINLYPKNAIYCPHLTLSLSLQNTIYTALDALSHAFESIWNKNSNPISTANALNTLDLIFQHLVPLTKNLHSLELRSKIMLASIYAGLAFCQTQTSLAHAISYPLTMKFDLPHGLACSFSLPLLLENLPKNSNAHNILMPFKRRLLALFEALEISHNPKDYGLDSAFIDEIFANLNDRAKNGIFDIKSVKMAFLASL